MDLENKFQVGSKKNLWEVAVLQGVITLGLVAAGWLTYQIINHSDEVREFFNYCLNPKNYF